ncbi:MAG TPA: DUF2723 domain-containing protein [Caldilineae bacterium]|nr:DUF2723 domain-containing protein [Caldilineae bacterium]
MTTTARHRTTPSLSDDRTIARPDGRGWIALILLLLIMGAIYWATLDNGLASGDLEGGDLITHQYAQVQARPSNAPGYPLYTMGGWLWFHAWRRLLPQASPIPILSSYSTLWALLALGALYLLLWRATRGNPILTLGLSAFYGVTYFFWYYAVSTEQYASAVLQTLLIVLVVLQWDEDGRERWLDALAFLLGLSLAHMVTVLFIAPGVLAFVLMKKPDLLKRGKLILGSLLLALTPLLAYIYVYVRGAAHPEWWGEGDWDNAWAWFLSFLSTRQGRDELTWSLLPWNPEQLGLFVGELGLFILALGGIGWWLWGRRHVILFALTAVIYLVFSYIDRFGNWYQVIMPLYPLFVAGAGVSLRALWERPPQRLWRVVLSLLLVSMVGIKFVEVYPRADQRDRPQDAGLAPGWAILEQAPPERAAIVGDVREKLALDYLTGVWGVRPDVTAIPTSDIAQAFEEGRAVLVTVNAASYAAAESGLPLCYTAWGPTLLLAGNGVLPQLPLEKMSLVAADVGDGLKLAGYQVLSGGTAPWWVRLALQAEETPAQDWAVSARLLAQGQEIAQVDHVAPALGFTPTASLHPGEIVFDIFAFNPPDGTPPPDALRFILYRQRQDGGFDNLATLDFPITRVIRVDDGR